jgi:S1-C subfamily serine protease
MSDSLVKGITVLNLIPDSNAAKAGIRSGDIIIAVNDVAVYTAADYAEQAITIHGNMKLDIIRNNNLYEIVIPYNAHNA